jgi:hypothetical protein
LIRSLGHRDALVESLARSGRRYRSLRINWGQRVDKRIQQRTGRIDIGRKVATRG